MSNVTRVEDESWTFQCPGVAGSPCGDPNTGQPFHSSGWPTRKVAEARGDEHLAEHETGEPMSELHAFRTKHGLVAHEDGIRAVQDGDAS